jgi:hypothetical protein
MMLRDLGGNMKKNKINKVFNKFFGFLDLVVSIINQVPANGKFPKARQTPYYKSHPWEKKRRGRPQNASKDQVHNAWPLGSERTETKIFNKLRKQRHGSN